MARRFLEIGRAAARWCDEKKAQDVLLLDVRKSSDLADFYVLATADSAPQLHAVQDHVAHRVKEDFGLNTLRQDASPQWSVLDYGGVVVHVMHRSARDFYALERLWESAKLMDWSAAAPAPVRKPSSSGAASRARSRTAKRSKRA